MTRITPKTIHASVTTATYSRLCVEDLLRDLVAFIATPNAAQQSLQHILYRLQQYDDSVAMPTLCHMLHDPSRTTQLVAAVMIFAVLADHPTQVCDEASLKYAEQLLDEALTCDDVELRGVACILLASAPIETHRPALRSLMSADDPHIRTFAAAALGEDLENISDILAILSSSAVSDDPLRMRIAMLGLLRLGVRADFLRDHVSRLVSERNETQLLAFLLSAKGCRKAADFLAETIVIVAQDSSLPTHVRGAALTTLGLVCTNPGHWRSAFITGLCSDAPDVIFGSVWGIFEAQYFDTEVVTALSRLLDSSDHTIREIAADTLAHAGGYLTAISPILINSLCNERHFEVLTSLASAVGACTTIKPESLIPLIESRDVIATMGASLALKRMGEKGGLALVEKIKSSTDPIIVGAVVAVLRDMGCASACSGEALADLVVSTSFDEVAHFAAMAMTSANTPPQRSVPSLIHCLLHRNADTANFARKALGQLGIHATSALHAARTSALPEQRARIDQALAGIDTHKVQRFSKLIAFNDDLALKRIAAASAVWKSHGMMSIREVAKKLSDIHKSKDEQLCFTERTLGTALKSLEAHLGDRELIFRAGSTRGRITPMGQRVFTQIHKYLEWKRLVEASRD